MRARRPGEQRQVEPSDELASPFRTAATSSLYGLESTGVLTTGLAVALMLAVAGVAGYLPARRAARLTPMQALRHDRRPRRLPGMLE